jgi:hypothetical protein
MDLPELAEDTRDGTFHKDISIGSLLGLLRHSHRYHQFVHRERVIAGQIVPGDGQNFHKAAREGLPTIRPTTKSFPCDHTGITARPVARQ